MEWDDNKRKEQRWSVKDFAKAQIEFWSRFNNPLLCILFIFLGFVFGIDNARGKRRNTSSIVILVTISYYVLYFTGISIAKKGNIPVWIVVFLPTLVGTLVGLKNYKKLEGVS